MDSLTQEQQRLPLWKFFFIYSGFISLIHWNFILNLTFYFDKLIAPGFYTYINLTYSVGLLISFLSTKYIFNSFSTPRQIVLTILLAALGYNLLGIILEIVENTLHRKIACICLILWYSFFAAFYQKKLSLFASMCGPISVQYFNIGIGFSGFSSNILAMIFVALFPAENSLFLKSNLNKQLVCYLILINLLVIIFLIVLYKYTERYGHFVSSIDLQPNIRLGSQHVLLANDINFTTRQINNMGRD